MSKKIVVGILGLPINPNYQFYLTRRDTPHKPAWHNKWQVAGGGLEFGEEPEETLKREMKEELDVQVEIVHPLPILKSQIWYGKESDHNQDTQVVLATYLVDMGNQIPKPEDDEETSAGGWFTYDQAMALDSLPLTPKILEIANQMCNEYGLWDKVTVLK